MGETRENRIKRLLYQSWYRGCKETDRIVGWFAKKHIHELSDAQIDEFEEIMAEDDKDIFNWLTGKITVPAKYDDNSVMKMLLDFDVAKANLEARN